jgi:hypothetical protein
VSHAHTWDVNIRPGHRIFERINITIFFTQETVISVLYLWKSRDLLGRYSKPAVENPRDSELNGMRRYANQNQRADNSIRVVRSILTQLIILNIIILFLDITLLVLEVSRPLYGILPASPKDFPTPRKPLLTLL